MPPVRSAAVSGPPAAAGAGGYGKALALLATLFFMWGFISVINNTLPTVRCATRRFRQIYRWWISC